MKLSEAKLTATVAVSDIDKAKEFYGTTLGLEQAMENPAGVGYENADGNLFIYKSDSAGSGKATCANWVVDDISSVVKDLKTKGVSFQTFEMPGATWEGEVTVMGNMKAAWFSDPDGNILGLSQM